ncbi:MAG: hypothetical protein RI513_06740, partial [Balneolaceae bacterium]|nr:hypothetical protein [Balneolaceae bacterium]
EALQVEGQTDTQAMSQQVDTLSASYGDKWQGVTSTAADPTLQTESAFVQLMGSNDLWPVVLGVSLIIWFVLLFFVYRLERRLHHVEASARASTHSSSNVMASSTADSPKPSITSTSPEPSST